jgi:hypothetical protein
MVSYSGPNRQPFSTLIYSHRAWPKQTDTFQGPCFKFPASPAAVIIILIILVNIQQTSLQ